MLVSCRRKVTRVSRVTPAASLIAAALCGGFVSAAADGLDRQRELVTAHFKSGEESTALDAHWTQPGIFKVGVLDNGSPRDGYAMYVCEVLAEMGFRNRRIQVQIIDIAKLVREDKWKAIGKAQCS